MIGGLAAIYKRRKEDDKLRYKIINKLYKDSTYEEFYKDWIYFNLRGHKDILEEIEQTFFLDLYYDKDCKYELALFSKGGLFKKQEKVFSTIIDTKEIVSVKGELDDFSIQMRGKTIHFGKTIIVL
ncbi:hypothetical protein IG7_00771 [Bacillus cereus HuA2-4]|nr:hypothetical protein IG7_00771 [Bacillus cereus HuA2-4]